MELHKRNPKPGSRPEVWEHCIAVKRINEEGDLSNSDGLWRCWASAPPTHCLLPIPSRQTGIPQLIILDLLVCIESITLLIVILGGRESTSELWEHAIVIPYLLHPTCSLWSWMIVLYCKFAGSSRMVLLCWHLVVPVISPWPWWTCFMFRLIIASFECFLCLFVVYKGEIQVFTNLEATKKIIDVAALLGKSTG